MTYRKEEIEIKGAVSAAKKRIRELMHYSILSTTPLEDILASAYLQGVIDAAEIQREKGEDE